MQSAEAHENHDLEIASGSLEEGQVRLATVKGLTADAVEIDLGEGKVASLSRAECPDAVVGGTLAVLLELLDEKSGRVLVSRAKAEALELWQRLTVASREHTELEGEIVGPTRGGLVVDVGLRAFLPASQVALERVEDLLPYVGQKVRVVIERFSGKRGNLVVTRRPILERERDAERAQTWKTLREGDVVTGRVRSLTGYGAFVDFAGVSGLLHASDLSWNYVSDPRQVVKVGDTVRVKVLKLDAAAQKISLGCKQLSEDPWRAVPERFPKGSRVPVKVLRMTEFGAFVELAPGVEGLVHVSELAWGKRVKHPSEVLKVGQVVDVMVLDIDTAERRIALGLKQTQDNPWLTFKKAHPVGTRVTGKVTSLADFGAFVSVPGGLEGLVHVSDLSWTERVRHASDKLKEGQELEVTVLNVDVDGERLALGVKQLQDDPWASFAAATPPGKAIKGTVTKVVDFGAFVELAPGIEGLCHVTELDTEARDARDAVEPGKVLEVSVVSVDLEARRISLSVRALNAPGDYREYLKAAPKGRATLGDALASKLKAKR